MEKNINNIGKQYKFLNEYNNKSFNIENLINKKSNEINLTAILSICSTGYICGDDTLVHGIKREKWLNEEIVQNLDAIKIEANERLSSLEIARKLKRMLKEEILNYIEDYNSVGVLLSGGLDSRIVAGVLKEVIEENKLGISVIAYNWGLKESRDVIYAEEIAKRYGWHYEYLELNAETLKKNFYNNIEIGCEISPIHLHCLNEVALDKRSEVVLAGTYGDSIGRGLFSGKHIKEIKRKPYEINNDLDLFNEEFYKQGKSYLTSVRFQYKSSISNKSYELDYYANYLRRMLTTPMSLISNEKPIYQIFTSPKIYKFILSLTMEQRNDEIYKQILITLPEMIGYIPYAKNGKIFVDENQEKQDDFYAKSHMYGKWLRVDLKEFINENYDVEKLYELGIFKPGSLERLYNLWGMSTNQSNTKLDETISFLTNLCLFLKKNNFQNREIQFKKSRKSTFLFLKNYLYIKLRNYTRP